MSQPDPVSLYKAEFDKLVVDANYSAQAYYEASKSADLWGRAIVFIPALLAAIASLLVALGFSKLWGVVGVLSAAVTATASLLGTQHRAAAFRVSGNCFTKIRHEARMWRDSFVQTQPADESVQELKKLRAEYAAAIDKIELPSNRFFTKARNRIGDGVLDYSSPSEPGQAAVLDSSLRPTT
jgi:hypothetical protein